MWMNICREKMPQRLTYRRRLCYNTRSNKIRVSKTPGGRLVFLYRKKLGSVPRCGDTGVKLKGEKKKKGEHKRHKACTSTSTVENDEETQKGIAHLWRLSVCGCGERAHYKGIPH
uniref:Large ribosomal subunit protein eL34 n=1 Tax=Parascaris univalens TaxID=6257 RepID=A0A915BLU4_PARUN